MAYTQEQLADTDLCRIYAERLRGMQWDLSLWMYGEGEADKIWDAIQAGADLLDAWGGTC